MKKEMKKSLKLKSVVNELNNIEKKAIKGGEEPIPHTCAVGYNNNQGAGAKCPNNKCDITWGIHS